MKQKKGEIKVPKTYKSFEEFYPFYLSEHSNRTNRRLHNVGSVLALISLLVIVLLGKFTLLFVPLLCGYGFAWVGHFFFQKNKPATFKYPLYSFLGDWVMLYDVIRGKIAF